MILIPAYKTEAERPYIGVQFDGEEECEYMRIGIDEDEMQDVGVGESVFIENVNESAIYIVVGIFKPICGEEERIEVYMSASLITRKPFDRRLIGNSVGIKEVVPVEV